MALSNGLTLSFGLRRRDRNPTRCMHRRRMNFMRHALPSRIQRLKRRPECPQVRLAGTNPLGILRILPQVLGRDLWRDESPKVYGQSKARGKPERPLRLGLP